MKKAEKTHNVDDLPTPYLKCRVFSHSWDEYVPVGKRKPPFGWRLSSICISCGTERHDLIGAAGQVVSREYVYPDGSTRGIAPAGAWPARCKPGASDQSATGLLSCASVYTRAPIS